MNFSDVKKVISIFEESKLTYMELEIEGMKIKMDKRDNQNDVKFVGGPIPPMPPMPHDDVKKDVETKTTDNRKYVTSPLVGTFHTSPQQGAEPFVSVGTKVKKGDKLCIIEAMKVMNEIKASESGEIKEILVKEGQMVEYDQKLFVIGD